jgi:hypothetical protein
MKRMTYRRPTTHYDERIKQIDEKICELIKQRREISDNNPGYPPFEYISNWAEKFGLYEELLKSIFSLLWNEKMYKPFVEPEGFRRNLPVLKSIEVDNRLFSVTYIHQYSNSSIVNFNIDWDSTSDLSERQPRHTHFELFIDERYDCRMANGTGGDGHFHYNFIVSPPLPDNTSGIELFFKEYNKPFEDKQISHNIVIRL